MDTTDGNNIALVLAIVLALTWWGVFAERHKVLGKVPGVVWILVTGLLLSNLQLIPMKSPVYDFVGGYLMPLSVPLLLYKASLRHMLHQSGKVLPIFLIGSLTVSLGALIGYYCLDLGAIGPKVAATYAAAWVGGAVNFIALSQITAMTPSEFSVALSASAPVSVLGLLALIALPSIPFVRRHIRSPIIDAQRLTGDTVEAESKPLLDPACIAAALALSAVICWASGLIAKHWAIETYSLFIVTLITVALANLFPKALSKLDGDFDLGMLIMYVFFAVIGASTDATAFIGAAPMLFVFGLIIIVVHLVVLLLVAKWLKFDLAEVIIGSGANIIGAAPSAGVASSKGWRNLVTPAITTGMLGYAIANFVGIAIFRWLS